MSPKKKPTRKDNLKKILKNYRSFSTFGRNKKFSKFSKFLKKHPKKKITTISIIAILLFLFSFLFFKDIPNPKKLTKSPAPVSTQILDRNGQILYEIFLDQNRTPIKLDSLPDHVKNSTISIEDKNFYSHHGLDFFGIARAFFKTVTGKD